jgi:hypothetical protein
MESVGLYIYGEMIEGDTCGSPRDAPSSLRRIVSLPGGVPLLGIMPIQVPLSPLKVRYQFVRPAFCINRFHDVGEVKRIPVKPSRASDRRRGRATLLSRLLFSLAR